MKNVLDVAAYMWIYPVLSSYYIFIVFAFLNAPSSSDLPECFLPLNIRTSSRMFFSSAQIIKYLLRISAECYFKCQLTFEK